METKGIVPKLGQAETVRRKAVDEGTRPSKKLKENETEKDYSYEKKMEMVENFLEDRRQVRQAKLEKIPHPPASKEKKLFRRY